LALVERNQHGDSGVQRLLHQDVVQFGIIIAKHIQIERHGYSRQNVLQKLVNIVTANEKQVNVFARIGGIGAFFRELGQIVQGEGLQVLRRIAQNIGWALLGRRFVVS